MNRYYAYALLAASLLCGCATTVVDDNHGMISGNSHTVAVTPATFQSPQNPATETWTVQEVSEFSSCFQVSFVAEGTENAFADDMNNIISGRLAKAGACVLTGNGGDFQFRFTPSFKVVDVSGELYRVDCQIGAELYSCKEGRIYDSMRFNYPSPKRQIGLGAAKAQFRDQAVQDCLVWAARALDTVAARRLAVTHVRFHYPVNVTLDPNWKAKKVEKLGEKLMKVPGILGYELVQDEKDTRDCVFRILHQQGAFPGGAANTIAAKINLDR